VNNVILDGRERYRSLSKQFENELAAIRELPGCERFLLGPAESELKDAATGGPIVVFNVSEIRSDALIVTSHGIRAIRLELLSQAELEAYCERFLNAIYVLHREDYIKARRELNAVLSWLWDVAVGPILSVLGFLETPRDGETWPRLWWVGSGLLNLLPLNAAGYHNGSSKNAIDRVISSYTPTIKATVYARQRQSALYNVLDQRVVLIGMPKTPGESDLYFVEEELRVLQSLVPAKALTLLNPTKEKVLSEIKTSQIVHLSCHGRSELDPSKSMLLVEDWRTSPLTVSDITALNIPLPQFAYLSACHTASNRDLRLRDEALNLVSATQLSGFPSVVGTLWQIGDRHSVDVVVEVYRWMLIDGQSFDNQRAAEGLHHAVRRLRNATRVRWSKKKGHEDPLIWVPYVHYGI
jgi:hypothetical protein